MKCTARIIKEYKTTKADCMWPMCSPSGYWIDNPDALKYPVCGGEVTVKLKAVDEPYYGGSSAILDLEETCSNCKHPFYEKKSLVAAKMHAYGGFDLTDLL